MRLETSPDKIQEIRHDIDQTLNGFSLLVGIPS